MRRVISLSVAAAVAVVGSVAVAEKRGAKAQKPATQAASQQSFPDYINSRNPSGAAQPGDKIPLVRGAATYWYDAMQMGTGTGGGGGSGTVTSVTAGQGLTGGTITSAGTISLLAPVAVSNGGTGATTTSLALDSLAGVSGTAAGALTRASGGAWSLVVGGGSGSGTVSNCMTANAIAYYGAAGTAVSCLGSTGTAGYVLTSNGAGAPSWTQLPSGGSATMAVGSSPVTGGAGGQRMLFNDAGTLREAALGSGLGLSGGTLAATNTVNQQAGAAYTIAASDGGKSVWMTNATAPTVTLVGASAAGANFSFELLCDAGCTVNRTGSDTIDWATAAGATTMTLPARTRVIFQSDGSAKWRAPGSTSAGGGGGITQLTGDVTAGPGSGSQAATLATIAGVAGSYTSANITVDGKGRVTVAASGTGGTASAGGTNFQMQVNNSGALGGVVNGAAGTVLTSNGTGAAPTFQPGGGAGGAYVLLGTQTTSPMVWTTLNTGTYRQHKLFCSGLTSSVASSAPVIQLSEDGGATWKASYRNGFSYRDVIQDMSNPTLNGGNAANTSIVVVNAPGTTANSSSGLEATFFNLGSATQHKIVNYTSTVWDNTAIWWLNGTGLYNVDTGAMNALHVTLASMTSGQCSLYGIAN